MLPNQWQIDRIRESIKHRRCRNDDALSSNARWLRTNDSDHQYFTPPWPPPYMSTIFGQVENPLSGYVSLRRSSLFIRCKFLKGRSSPRGCLTFRYIASWHQLIPFSWRLTPNWFGRFEWFSAILDYSSKWKWSIFLVWITDFLDCLSSSTKCEWVLIG